MDPSYPEDRLTIYAEDSHAAVVLAQAHNLDLACRVASNILCMHECIPGPDEAYENPQIKGIGPESTCLVLFTSGSTGRPKGVHHAHRHLREVIMGTVDYFGLTSEDVILMTNTICFDVHMIQMYPPLVAGGRLILAKPDGHMDPDYIASKIVEHNVTGLIFTVPFLAKMYVQSPIFDQPYAHMKHWGMGGDAVPLDIVHHMQRIFPSMDGPVDSYGPTEGNVVTQYRFPLGAQCSLIGVPDINVHCGIVDSTMQMLPRGVPGELLLSGPRMALGYYGKPDLTAEKFIPNPLFSWIEQRVPDSMKDMYKIAYRTGDLVRLRDDGNLEYLGRIDRQVKINGVRIELGEVEGVIRGIQGVQNAVCSAVKRKESEGKVLVAYVVPESVSEAEVIGSCSKELLPSMVPSHVVCMKTFPLLPNGKVDVKSLPHPDWNSTEEEFAPAETEVEGKIEQIWMNVLDRQEPISMTSSFFSIGGDSLLANQVIGQLRRELDNQEITVSMLFENTTIRSLASVIANILSDDNNTKNRWTTLRSTTIKVKPSSSFLSRQNISKNAFLGLLGRSKTITRQMLENDSTDEHQDKVILSAESTNIAKYASADRKSRMPFIVYLVLQLISSSLIPCVFPSLTVCFCLLMHLALKHFSGILIVLACPIVYAICMNFGSLAILIILKRMLFPKKMAAGVYPVHGSVYLKWIFFRCLQHKVIEYNFRYVRRSPLIVAIFNALGANIRYNVILDSPNVVDPDLITMQSMSTLGEGASVKGSFIVPAGVLGKQAALVLSPSRIGISCDIGLAANVQAGGHIFSGHSLKPYGTLSQSTDVLDTEKMKELYPHFYPEAFLKPGFVFCATLIQWLILYLCCLPVSVVCISAAKLVMYFMQIPDISDSVISLSTFILMEILLIKWVANLCMPKLVNAVVIYYKRTFMGPLRPGRNLVTDSLDCLAYCIYRKLMDIPYFNYYATAVPLGLNIDKSTGIKDGIYEHDAVTIQARGTSGGKTYFRTVNTTGTIMGIQIGEEVSCGNCAFFPGSKVGDRSQVGNETSLPCKKVIPMDVQVQADRIIELGSAMQRNGRKETPPPFSISSQIALKKETPWNIAYWILIHIPTLSLVPLLASYHCSLVIPGMIMSSALHFVTNAAWIRLRLVHLRFKDIVKDGESLCNSPECHAAYLQAAFGIFGLSDFLWPVIGTPIYNYILRYVMGLEVHPNAIIHTAIMIEAHLWKIGNAVLDYATMVVPHYMKSGSYWFHDVNVPDGAWIGANCRILVPSSMESDSRVLPGTTILPRECISRGTVWSGIPGAPVTKHVVKKI
jgi:amino acid adenylation domain-containing protein